MNISKILDNIIDKRTQKAQSKEVQEKELLRKKESAEQLQEMYTQISKLSLREQELMCGRETAEVLRNSESIAAQCMEAYDKAIQSVHALKVRFQRPTINLVVIGKIGSGKSKFLQSASGLDDNCIPSLKGPSCTGVTSVLENINDEETNAYFTFKTKEEVLEDINQEAENLAKSIQELLEDGGEFVSFQPITGLEAGGIYKVFNKLKNAAENISKNNQGIIETHAKKLMNRADGLLQAYAEDQNRSEWLPYIGASETGSENLPDADLIPIEAENGTYQYVLSDPEKIKKYVSKHSGETTYYRYIAVKGAVIKTRILGIDARIRLVDTVGIGDPAADTKKRMEEAIRDESDGVIFLSQVPGRIDLPKSLDEEDIPFFEELRELFQKYKKADAGYWMAFLLNPYNADEFAAKYLKIVTETYGGPSDMFGERGIQYKKVVDVGDAFEVNQMLKEFLGQIAEHLDTIDERLEKEAKELCRLAEIQGQILKTELRDIRLNPVGQQNLNYIQILEEERLSRLQEELKGFSLSITRQGKEHKDETSFLKQRLDMVRMLKDNQSVDKLHMDLDSMIEASCKKHIYIANARLEAIKTLKKTIRKIGTLRSESQERSEAEYKQKIAEIFVQCIQIDLEESSRYRINPLRESNTDFFKEIGEILFTGIWNVSELKEAFDSLNNFRLNEMNALTKTLFYHHAEKYLIDNPYEEASDNQTFAELQEEGQEMQDYLASEYYISEEQKRMLKKELQNKLELFIQAVEEDTGNETYLVDYYDQMNEELYNFMQILNPEHQGKWIIVLNGLKEQGLLIENREEQERLELLKLVSEKVNDCFAEGRFFQ